MLSPKPLGEAVHARRASPILSPKNAPPAPHEGHSGAETPSVWAGGARPCSHPCLTQEEGLYPGVIDRSIRMRRVEARPRSGKGFPYDFDKFRGSALMGRGRYGGPICEACPSIDVRLWAREGKLLPGQSFEVAWACDGERCASIGVRTEWQTVVPTFRVRQAEGWEDVHQRGRLLGRRVTWAAAVHGFSAAFRPMAKPVGGA
jgi:hypothetical protein